MDGSRFVSVQVLVIPEDPTNNGYILKPVVDMVLAEAGKPAAKVRVLGNPRVRGYDDAVRVVRKDLASRYGFMDLWLFLPDADRASSGAMQVLEEDLHAQGVTLLCCPAVPEVEVYACVAYRGEIASWQEVRADPRMREAYFDPLLEKHGDRRKPGRGRRMMIERSLRSRRAFFQLCPEIADLRDRVQASLAS